MKVAADGTFPFLGVFSSVQASEFSAAFGTAALYVGMVT
jgi:hypothetical protein